MARHPDTDLVPYLRGELPPAERERVARHLEECPDCKQDTELLRDLLGNLAHAIGEPPTVNWARYRAELREKLEARRAHVGMVAASDAARAVGEPRRPPAVRRGLGRSRDVSTRAIRSARTKWSSAQELGLLAGLAHRRAARSPRRSRGPSQPRRPCLGPPGLAVRRTRIWLALGLLGAVGERDGDVVVGCRRWRRAAAARCPDAARPRPAQGNRPSTGSASCYTRMPILERMKILESMPSSETAPRQTPAPNEAKER